MRLPYYDEEGKKLWDEFKSDFLQKNSEEIGMLEYIKETHLLKENIFQKYMENKCVVTMSPYSHKILIHFLQFRVMAILLQIFNLHIDFRITSDKWALEQHSSIALLVPYTADQLNDINKKSIAWGRLLISPEANLLKDTIKSKRGDPSLPLLLNPTLPLANLVLYCVLSL